MTIAELIRDLEQFDLSSEIMVLDGFNGGGSPREINLGPQSFKVRKSDTSDCADCEGLEGKKVIVLGYGCY